MGSIIIVQPTPVPHLFQWIFVNNQVVDETLHEGNILELAKKMQGQSLWLLLPSPHVLITQLTLPNIKKSLLPQALNFSLESQLTCSLEDLYICMGEKEKNCPIFVASISKQKLATLTQPFEEQKIAIQHIYPSILCQPADKNSWHIMVDNNIASVRTGTNSGFSCDSYNLYEILNSHLQENSKKNHIPQYITIQSSEENNTPDIINRGITEKNIRPEIILKTVKNENTLILLAKNLIKNRPSIDFKNPTKALNQKKNKIPSIYYWLISGMLATILSLALLNKFFDYRYFSKKQMIVNLFLSEIGIKPDNYTHLKQIKSSINYRKNTDTFNPLYFKIKKSLYFFTNIIINSIQYENRSITLIFLTKNKDILEKFIKNISLSLKIQKKIVEKSENYLKISLTIEEQ